MRLDQPAAAFEPERSEQPLPLWPGMREAVLLVLGASPTPLSAYDITDELTQRYSRKRHANSVYRALRTLTASRDVSLIATWRKFTLSKRQQAACGWLLCEECQTARPIPIAEISCALEKLASEHQFKATRMVLELPGVCASCARPNSSNS